MSGGEAGVRIGMQNAGLRNPPIEDWGETIPPHLCALTATDQDAPPQPANATLKDAQLSRVPRNGMILVVAQHNLAKPCTDRASIPPPSVRYAHSGVELPPAGDSQHTHQHLCDRAYEHRHRRGTVHFERRSIPLRAVGEVVSHELLGPGKHARSSTVRLVCGNINGQ